MPTPPTRTPGRTLVAAACVVAGLLLAGPGSSGSSIGTSFWWIWCLAVVAFFGALPAMLMPAFMPAIMPAVVRAVAPPIVHGSLLAIAVVAVSCAWATLRHDRVAPGDLRAVAFGRTPGPTPGPTPGRKGGRTERRTGGGNGVVRVAGTVVDDPVMTGAGDSVLARFHYRAPAWRFELVIDAVLDRSGRARAASGRVLVLLAEAVGPLRAGDRVRVMGMLRPPSPARNPGAMDPRRFARARGSAGVLSVPRRELLVIEHRGDDAFRRWRATLRNAAERRLLADLPNGATDGPRNALLLALLLGRREPGFGSLHDAFRRVGLAHLLAISGLHLGVLLGFAMLMARLAGMQRRCLEGVLVIALVGAYLLLVEARLPVLRAGLMAAAVGLGMIARRRWPTESLVVVAALLLLAWRPSELANPGFQLSFGVVLGLLRGVPAVRQRWFPMASGGAGTFGDVLRSYFVGACCVAVVAWAIATPIVLHHFGMMSPGTVPLSIASLPVTTAVLVLGYAKMIVSLVLPIGAILLATPLVAATDLLRLLVSIADALPGSVVHLPRPGTPWTITALAVSSRHSRCRLRGRPESCIDGACSPAPASCSERGCWHR